MRKIRWSEVSEFIEAVWLAYVTVGAGAFGLLYFLGVPILPNLLIVFGGIVAAIIIEQRFMQLRNSCPSCRMAV
jgi:hypothetical protein